MFNYDFMQNAFFVAICISLLCPCIGIFMVLRRSSMIGDTMSHASLAGITLGLLTNTNPILGAFIFTAICGALIEFLRKYFSHHLDLILTIILSLSIGTAITLISSGKLKANANVFFFGSILTVNATDMISIAVLLNVAPGGFVSLTSVGILLVVLVIKNIRTIIRRFQFSR